MIEHINYRIVNWLVLNELFTSHNPRNKKCANKDSSRYTYFLKFFYCTVCKFVERHSHHLKTYSVEYWDGY
jgi:hypothetical protein